MKLSSLRQFLDAKISAQELLSEVHLELSAYSRGLQELGRAVPVPVNEDLELMVSRADVATLCRALVSGDLGSVHLSYIADVIQLADRVSVEDQWVADAIAECTDPEIQGEFTLDRAQSMISRAEV